MNFSDDTVRNVLAFDPIAAAEEVCDGEGAVALGMVLAMDHGAVKERMLTEMGDTTLNNDLDRYISIIEAAGFEKALELPFTGKSWHGEEPPQEKFFIYARRDGLLLKFDTFDTTSVNSGNVYYAHRPFPTENLLSPYSSGSYHLDRAWPDEGCPDDAWWFGDHDAREALLWKIDQLKKSGTFLNPWPKATDRGGNFKPCFIWLLHYRDTVTADGTDKTYDYRQISRDRVAMCPQWVQDMVNGTI